MGEWGVALIAAGSAVLGSVVTGWFTLGAGHRQADATRHAGDRQADAVLETMRQTLGEQRVQRELDRRRDVYGAFLAAAESVAVAQRSGEGKPGGSAELYRAMSQVALEGPPEMEAAARTVVDRLRRSHPLTEIDQATRGFIEAAQRALAL